MRQRLVVVPVVLGVTLLVAGCATKKFVREELDKNETALGQKIGQDVARLERELGREKAELSGVAARVTETRSVAGEATRKADQAASVARQASTQADDAATKAAQATGAAGQALAKAAEVDNRLSRLVAVPNKRVLANTMVVLFTFDKWQLDDRAHTVLLEVVKRLQANPGLVVDLEGYTDNVGPPLYNVGLSQRRAESVRRFLVEKGVELNRIQSIGLGDGRPVADNKTRQGRDQNRRVAVKLFAPAE